jgi:hypothetical protein
MPLQIKPDFKQFNKFKKLGKSQTIGVIKRSIRATLNDQAYSTQKRAKFVELPRSMTVRGKFNQSRIKVTTARGRDMTAEVGDISKGTYLGLFNLEKGLSENNKAIPHLQERRGGSRKRKIGKSKRLNSKPVRNVRTGGALSKLSISGYKGLFKMVNKSTKLNPGIYQFYGRTTITTNGFKRRKIEMVYDTQHPKTKANRNKWLERSTRHGASAKLTKRFWQRNQKRMLDKALQRLTT